MSHQPDMLPQMHPTRSKPQAGVARACLPGHACVTTLCYRNRETRGLSSTCAAPRLRSAQPSPQALVVRDEIELRHHSTPTLIGEALPVRYARANRQKMGSVIVKVRAGTSSDSVGASDES